MVTVHQYRASLSKTSREKNFAICKYVDKAQKLPFSHLRLTLIFEIKYFSVHIDGYLLNKSSLSKNAKCKMSSPDVNEQGNLPIMLCFVT